MEFLWGKKVKGVDLYRVSLCSESWFFKNREVFLKLGTHIGSLATGVLEMMGRGYPFQIFTNLLLLKVNIVRCNMITTIITTIMITQAKLREMKTAKPRRENLR